jgi:hypothetical protein
LSTVTSVNGESAITELWIVMTTFNPTIQMTEPAVAPGLPAASTQTKGKVDLGRRKDIGQKDKKGSSV